LPVSRRRFVRTALAASVTLLPGGARAAYPEHPVRLIVPFAAGGAVDSVARVLAKALTANLDGSIVIDNRGGAGGVIGMEAAAHAPADGYTLLLSHSGFAAMPGLYRDLPFDPVRDFAGIALIGETAAVVVVAPSLGTRTLKAFVDLARAKPGTINYASAGIGTATHLAGAYFARQAGIDMVHVPYKTGSALIADLVEGRVQATFSPAAFTLPMLQDGKLLALAVSSREAMRDPIAVPTALSADIDYEYATWYGFLAPAKTPAAILQTLNNAIAELGRDPELQAKIAAQGIAPRSIGLRDFDAHIRREMGRLDPLLKSIGSQIGN
jgi:tripartite-type tricarboxylate transporter receptor subunit TctC